MKIQLDTIQKTVAIEENINVKELFDKLKVLLGNEFDEFTITPHYTYYYTNPIYIPPVIPTTEPPYNPNSPWYVTYTNDETPFVMSSESCVYNIDMK